MNPASESWPVAIFAHNEAEHILACLESLAPAAPGMRLECFVLANACTDETGPLVMKYAAEHPGIHLVSIKVGDKSNAWNVYV
ncbi:MAG: glycosyltransferase, partial [Betaproteobacteria bacterium]